MAVWLMLLFTLGVAACGSNPGQSKLSQPPSTPTVIPSDTADTSGKVLAPELRGIASWINSDPITLGSNRGKVILIDFWTYTCINCIRTIPYLANWHGKYADMGLVIVGVHTPEFDFERIRENVAAATADFGIEYAVAQDNGYETWTAFGNRYWPAKYLIDKDGYVRYTHFGEGAYAETERNIRELLTETGRDLTNVPYFSKPVPVFHPGAHATDPEKSVTRELYAGYDRNYSLFRSQMAPPYVLNNQYYQAPNINVMYKDPGKHKNHFIYLNGLWRNTEESLVHSRNTQDHEDYVAINFYATSANAVMASDDLNGSKVVLTVNGSPLDPGLAGTDVMFDEDGNSYVQVSESRMYRLIDTPVFGGRELRVSPSSKGVSIFAFTFGSYSGGEPGPKP